MNGVVWTARRASGEVIHSWTARSGLISDVDRVAMAASLRRMDAMSRAIDAALTEPLRPGAYFKWDPPVPAPFVSTDGELAEFSEAWWASVAPPRERLLRRAWRVVHGV